MPNPGPGTLENELQALGAACNWATRFRHAGRPLLTFNPVRGLTLPHEENPARPLTTEERYKKLLGVADQADSMGRLRCLLVLAHETGRRISSIIHLRRSDILLNADQLRVTLAAEGQDESLADHWHRGIRWRAETDKQGYLSFSPITATAKDALELYLRTHSVVGDAWLFPWNKNRLAEPMSRPWRCTG